MDSFYEMAVVESRNADRNDANHISSVVSHYRLTHTAITNFAE